MPTVQCPGCGKAVRFEGTAGVCPNCASVVRAKTAAAPGGPSTGRTSAPAKGGRRSQPHLEDVENDEPDVFNPASSRVAAPSHNPFAAIMQLDKRLLFTIVGGIFIVVIFGLYEVLHTPKPSDETIAPPPAVLTYSTQQNKPTDSGNPSPVKSVDVAQPIPPPIISSATQASTRPAWITARAVKPAEKPVTFSDQIVDQSIRKGVAYLKSSFKGNALNPEGVEGDLYPGSSALSVYALLHAGEAIDDNSLGSSSPFIQSALDHLKTFDYSDGKATYEHSLRAQALGMFNREQDRDQLSKDRQWLLKAEVGGAYNYTLPDPGTKPQDFSWDHSNSQYGVLGIWASTMAGQTVPDKYWTDVETHWLSFQNPDGGWGYHGHDDSSLTMTSAGVTTLCVAAEQMGTVAIKGTKNDPRPKFAAAVQKGVDFLGQGDRLINIGNSPGYALYGVERAALATGYRWFGTHDWYRELGEAVVKEQSKTDGSWAGAWGSAVESSFRLLFLSRGRQPLLMDKLRFNGDWDDRPRDAAKLAQFVGGQLEKPFAWGVAELSRDWWDWLESPVLFISTDAPPDFSDEDCDKLRSYTQAGGMIFLHNENASRDVDAFAHQLCSRLYPDYPLKPVAPDDLLYSDAFSIKTKTPLMSVSNGTRTLLVYSPKDITQDWIRWKVRDSANNALLQTGLNLFVMSAGKNDFRNRLNTPYLKQPDDPAIASIPVAQITYPGPWNPEPGAFLRFPRYFQNQTSMTLEIHPTDIRAITFENTPVALMTGNTAVDFSKADFSALRDYVNAGGVLLIDSTGGSKAFADSVRNDMLSRAFPGIRPTGIPLDHPLLSGRLPCTDQLTKPHLRNYAASVLNGVAPHVQYATVGKGTVIISDIDITTGLLDSGTYNILGYTPAYCNSFLKNVILWAKSRY